MAGKVKVAISHGNSAKNTALGVKVKCQKKVAKLTPEILKRGLGREFWDVHTKTPKRTKKEAGK